MDRRALVLRHKGQNLQDNIAQKRPHQILSPTGVQQGHIQHDNIHLLLLGQDAPLLQNLTIIAPQTINALDIEQIVFFQPPQQLPIHGAVEILPRLLVHIDVPGVDVQRRQRIQLTILSLFLCAHACIGKNMICQSIVLQAFFNSLQKNVQKNYRTTDRQSE